jgi:hypothetical protein
MRARAGYFVGLIVVVLVFSYLTRVILDDYNLESTYRQLITLIVALTVCGIYAFAARRLLR